MKKTFVTTMPNHIGAFLKASECLASLGINITRVSYNKAIDSHTLFIDAEGSREQLAEADKQLTKIGYLQNNKIDQSIVLLEFCLRDVPGSVTDVLILINKFNFNISYISSQENGTDYQYFKMGLFVDDADKISEFLSEAEKLCDVRVIDYNRSEKIYDNSIFYKSFVNEISNLMGLSERATDELLINSNLAMQTLDEQGLSPYKTFESISRFAELLAVCRGKNFSPRITRHNITDKTEIILIEPPCGSNTIIIKSVNEALFIDCGYAVYRDEMINIFNDIFQSFGNMKKKILITHADVDHCGLLSLFDEIVCSKKTSDCLRLEYENRDGLREQNPLHKPYIKMCKVLTDYAPVNPEKVNGIWERKSENEKPLEYVGTFDFEELHFDVYEGKGGHLPGEIVLIERKYKLAFTGDIYINLHGLTGAQAKYNQYAPILMTSVDTDVSLCKTEREAIIGLLEEAGQWQIFGSHGSKKDYNRTT